jgi:hypothetical protein
MNVPRMLLMLMRITAVVQVVLGIGFWTGHWYGAQPVHMAIGTGYVLVLWILAVIALFQRRAIGPALGALLWGFILAMLGYSQQGLLPESSLHWIVRVVHLIVGLAALGFAERLAPVRGRPELPAATTAA